MNKIRYCLQHANTDCNAIPQITANSCGLLHGVFITLDSRSLHPGRDDGAENTSLSTTHARIAMSASCSSPGNLHRENQRPLIYTAFPSFLVMTIMPTATAALTTDELDILAELLPAPGPTIIELGCGAAWMARKMLQRWPLLTYLGLEVDHIQHGRNLQDPPIGMRFAAAGAEDIPTPDAAFDLALMLKSLHHIPLAAMDQALDEIARVLRPGGHLYVSEPVYAGALNDIVRLYNDEGVVRAAAQAAVDRALAKPGSCWQEVAQRRFDMPVRYADFAEFERRMLYPTFTTHQIDDALLARIAAAFAPHCGSDGAHFVRPMHVRLLQRA